MKMKGLGFYNFVIIETLATLNQKTRKFNIVGNKESGTVSKMRKQDLVQLQKDLDQQKVDKLLQKLETSFSNEELQIIKQNINKK